MKRASLKSKPVRRSPGPGRGAPKEGPPSHIVGIGASAGGLEAFKSLLASLPVDTGMAFVLVQHLSPQHESMLAEILSWATRMPVQELTDGTRLRANHVYVTPPNALLGLMNAVVHVMPNPSGSWRTSLPIDFFFRTLAQDQKGAAIGIVLSGTGSDGAEGLKTLKAEGGITFAQDPRTARFEGMPNAAIAIDDVDLVLSPEQIAQELVKIGKHPYMARAARHAPDEEPLSRDPADLNKVFLLLKQAKRVDFTHYKHTTINRRIRRRMVIHRIEKLPQYVRYLEGSPEELGQLYSDILIGVTAFFRDPEVFDALKAKVLPALLKERNPKDPFRVWVPGCSTGEEVYSIAIVLLEALGEKAIGARIQIFGTDLNESCLEKARLGEYGPGIAAQVSGTRLERFFTRSGDMYRIDKSVRDLCVFAKQDVTADPPFTRLDLVSCRNLLIYLGPVLQKRVIATFQYALKQPGYLILGTSETIGISSDLFSLAAPKHKIYARKPSSIRIPPQLAPGDYGLRKETAAGAAIADSNPFDVQSEVRRIFLTRYAPPSVVVDGAMEVRQFCGRTSPYLEHGVGQASLNILKLARESLVAGLRSALEEAKKKDARARRPGLKVRRGKQLVGVAVEVIPLKGLSGDRCFLVVFEEEGEAETSPSARRGAKAGRVGAQGLAKLRAELSATQEYLHSVIQELEAANQALQAANEETLSSNEELQSTNEEIETGKEELQSANEELSTVNDELQGRNAELHKLNTELTNLLACIDVPILIVSSDFVLRRFTPAARSVINVIPSDIGRPISDLTFKVQIPNFKHLILEAIESRRTVEEEVRDENGSWHMLQIRPYSAVSLGLEGAIISFLNIDMVKMNQVVRDARDLSEAIVEAIRQPLVVLDHQLRVVAANHAFYEMFSVRREDAAGRAVHELGDGRWGSPGLKSLLQNVLPTNRAVEGVEVDHPLFPAGNRKVRLSARPIPLDGRPKGIILLSIAESAAEAAKP